MTALNYLPRAIKLVNKSEGFGERRSKLWRIIGTESPFKKKKGRIQNLNQSTSNTAIHLFKQGNYFLSEGAYYEAEEAYKKSLTHEEFPEAHNNYAILLDKVARYQEADHHFKQAMALSPPNPQILNNYIDFLIHVDLMETARKYAKQWTKLSPKKPKPWLKHAFTLAYQGEFKKAETQFSTYENLVSSKEHAFTQAPFRTSNYLKFAIRLAFLGSDRARTYVEKLHAQDELYTQIKGLALTLLGEYEEAAHVFEDKMSKNPNISPDIRIAYSSLLEKRGKLEEAEELLRNALQEMPQDATSFSHLANLLLMSGKDEQARKYHKKAISAAPRNALVNFSYAQFLLRKEEEAANTYFLKALDIAPRSPEVHLAYGNYLTGIGRDESAAYHLTRASDLNSQDSLIHLSLARFFKLRGEWGKWEKHKKKAYFLNAEAVKDHYWWF